MVTHVRTFGLSGITGFSVDAEINIAKGLPDFDIIGMGNMAVREAAGRIRAALENSGYPFPLGRVTVNLAPAGIRKEGACYDLQLRWESCCAAAVPAYARTPLRLSENFPWTDFCGRCAVFYP